MKTTPFLEDIYPRHLLYAITIRSPIAAGYLKMIQYPKLPEHYKIITARDIPGENKFGDTNMPILAYSRLSYIGEPVALILGPDKIKLENLAAKCIVFIDEEKPVLSSINNNDKAVKVRDFSHGNVDKAFEKEDLIVTSSYSTGIQDHWYAEPSGAITWYNHRNLFIKTATQHPYHVKKSVAQVLNQDPASVIVEQTDLSLHMDGKLWFPSLLSCHAALGTYITKKPVRLILSREEDFFFSPKRAESTIDIVSTIEKNGKITASKMDISVNLGAYEVYGDEILDQICVGTAGLYKINNVKIHANAVCTNLPPQGPFTGFGLSQGFFAIERHISIIADMVKQDPALWRKQNLTNQALIPLIDLTIKNSDYPRKWASYQLLRQTHENESPRGIGISVGFQGNGLMHNPPNASYTVEAVLTKEGGLEIKTSIASSEDYSRIWEKIAMDIISIDPGLVKIIKNNAPDCGPSCSSRNITIITKLVEKCCEAIKKQKSKSSLPITVRKSIKSDKLNNCFAKPSYACAIVEVSIDLVECTPRIRGVWLGVDAGKIISKNRAKRALIRSSVQALGWAFTENIEYINGELTKNQYDNFSIPSPVEIPPIHIEFLTNDKASDPKGIGELPFTCIPSAFLQAVSQAMDHAFKNLPLKRTNIWEMVRLRGENGN